MTAPRLELIAGLLCALTGVAGVVYAVLGRTYIQLSDGLETRVRMVDVQELQPLTVVALVVLAALPVGVSIGSYLPEVKGLRIGRILILTATAVLVVLFWLTGLSLGPLLAPSVVLAALTSAIAVARGDLPAER